MVRSTWTDQAPQLQAQGMSAAGILQAIAERAAQQASCVGHGLPDEPWPAVQVVVDVTDAWSIPWTAQPIELPLGPRQSREAFVRCRGLRRHEDRTEAVYEVTG